MVEKNPVAGVHPVRLAIIYRDPVRVHFGATVGASRIKRRFLGLRDLLHKTVHLAGRCLIKPRIDPRLPNGLQKPDRSHTRHVARVFGVVKTDTDMALGRQIVHFIRFDVGCKPAKAACVGQIAVMQVEAGFGIVRIEVDWVETPGVKTAGATDDPMHLIPFGEQQLRQIRSILAANAGY